MFEIKNKIIKITKGDSAIINVDLKYSDGSEYTMSAGDTLTFTVKKSLSGSALLQVVSTTNVIELEPSQTKNLSVGGCYYDIQLDTSDGNVYTVVGIDDCCGANMIVWNEVTV